MNTRKNWSSKCWEIMPRCKKNWEDSAGKPYKKPAKLTTGVIAGTVKEAQNALCGLFLGRIHGLLTDYYSQPGTEYPQSLGELCIELVQERISLAKKLHPEMRKEFVAVQWADTVNKRWPDGSQRIYVGDGQFDIGFDVSRRDIQELRTKMWHRANIGEAEYHTHNDPYEERLYQITQEDQ